MLRILRFVLLSLILTAPAYLYGQAGLRPFEPPQGAKVSKDLRTGPENESPILRTLDATDRVFVVRSEGSWYEVEVKSSEGLTFRGWLFAEIPIEKRAPEARDYNPNLEIRNTESPIASKKFRWIWDKGFRDRGSFSIRGGTQNLLYGLSGTQAGQVNQIYQNNFFGMAVEADARLQLMRAETQIPFSWNLFGNYAYSLYRLSFATNFIVSELQGEGYEISTHSFKLCAPLLLHIKENQTTGTSFKVGLGPAYVSHQVAPDLRPIQSGIFTGQLVFVETSLWAAAGGLFLDFVKERRYFLNAYFLYLIYGSISETSTQTQDLSLSGFRYVAGLGFTWKVLESLGLDAQVEYLNAIGQGSGTGLQRLDDIYSNGRVTFGYIRGTVGGRVFF